VGDVWFWLPQLLCGMGGDDNGDAQVHLPLFLLQPALLLLQK
jgi:hypothetical protein